MALDRVEKALAMVDRNGQGLEIGPSFSPMAPKREGFNVHVVDYLNAEDLRNKYKDANVDIDQIEEVDFVWRGERLHELVQNSHSYDWVIASHVIEHVPDIVSFLIGCEQVLKPGGVLSLVIPDKRLCFDHFRPLSTTGEMLDAFDQARSRPSAGVVFDDLANAVVRGQDIAWTDGDPRPFSSFNTFERTRELWERVRSSEDYIDVHVWRFIPQSFRLVLQDLRVLKLVTLGIKTEFDTTGSEFHVTLGREPLPDGVVDRLELLRQLAGAGQAELAGRLHADSSSLEGPGMAVTEFERSLLVIKRKILATLRERHGRSA